MNLPNIQNLIIENIKVLNEMAVSLQKEFEFMFSYTSDEKTLKAKQNQIKKIRFLIMDQNEILNNTFKIFEQIEKAEYCLINYGVSRFEYELFLNKPLKHITEMAKQNKKENTVQLPLIFRENVNYDQLKTEKEIKTAVKPVYNLTQLKQMAQTAGPSF